ncbi:Hint domain-containing protein [Pukyongiella litopenaei]|uniref:Hint domain-containing protein n=1 Tax=Pukyongiella litopenaei TaxID=2605946 RepID=A0A2S0MPC0_9RHOB|nr:Hint domain-containing protein [Pukyongiella litopenaei]AVO37715.1 Hint domain-containing protein [Pukyongiella litopenaei]
MTTFNEQFYDIDPFSPPSPGTLLTPQFLEMVDVDNDGVIGPGDTIDGRTITQSWPDDRISVDDDNIAGGEYSITGVTYYFAGGGTLFTPIDGTVLKETYFQSTEQLSPGQSGVPTDRFGPPCFTPGTLIDTADGARAIETLRPGDLVRTADAGLQTLLGLERRTFRARGKCAPVLIREGALGNRRDLRVSQEHRMLITGWRAEMATGSDEVLVAAKHLVNGNSIVIDETETVDYIHLLFDRHQIVFAEGIASESFLPAFAVDRAEAGVNRETLDLFPELLRNSAGFAQTARPVARRREALLLRDAA